LLDDRRIRIQIHTSLIDPDPDPDPGGPKTYTDGLMRNEKRNIDQKQVEDPRF
jgi:hypothetical protein